MKSFLFSLTLAIIARALAFVNRFFSDFLTNFHFLESESY